MSEENNNMPPRVTPPPPPPPPVYPEQSGPELEPRPEPEQMPQSFDPVVPPVVPQPYPAPEYGPPPVRRSRTPLLVLAIVLIVLLASGITAYAFRDEILLRAKPELYLVNSMRKTINNLLDTPSTLPDSGKFAGQPVEHSLSLRLDEINSGEFAPYLSGLGDSSLVLHAKTDWAGSQMLLGFTVRSAWMSLPDNQVYISPQLIGVSIPSMLSSYGFLTAEPGSFARNWNTSSLMEEVMPGSYLPENLPVEAGIESFFAALREADALHGTPLSQQMAEDVEELLESIQQDIRIQNHGREVIDGVKYIHLSSTLSREEAARAIQNAAAILFEAYRQTARENPLYADTLWEVEEFIDSLRDLTFSADLILDYYIDPEGRLTRIAMPEIHYTLPDYSSTEEYRLSFSVNATGKQNLADQLQVELFFEDPAYEESTEILLTRVSQHQGDTVRTLWEFSTSHTAMGYPPENLLLAYDFEWEKNAQTSDNMRLHLLAESDFESAAVEITGNLVETGQKIELSSGKLRLLQEGAALVTVGVELHTRPITSADVSLEGKQTTDLFSLRYEDLYNAFLNSFRLIGR